MSVKPTNYTWTCDWCEKTEFHSSSEEAPEGWREPKQDLDSLSADHVCSEDCEDNLYKADDIAYNLGEDLKKLVRYHWGKPRVSVPSVEEVSVQVEQYNGSGKPQVLITPMNV